MREKPVATVVVSDRLSTGFLPDALESALGQTYAPTEVIVVCGSGTRESLRLLTDPAVRIVSIGNGWDQASALSLGLSESHGEVVLFVEAEDFLAPGAVERAVMLLSHPTVVKAHWRLWVVDAEGRWTGEMVPRKRLPAGDLSHQVARFGPEAYPLPPLSANAWRREFLEEVVPFAASDSRIPLDTYLSAVAPLYGRVGRSREPLGCYRLHEGRHLKTGNFEETLMAVVGGHDQVVTAIADGFERLGKPCAVDDWRSHFWFPRLKRAWEDLRGVVSPGVPFILVDEDTWGLRDANYPSIPFPEHAGLYWGPPADDAAASRELRRLHAAGARFIAVAWPAFWWLDHYAGFAAHLRSCFDCRLETPDIVVWELTG